jgi:hypothetical protein
MSDGPHRSLRMSPAWRELSKRADQRSYSIEDTVQAVSPALESDWQIEDCDRLISRIRNILGDERQSGLFPGQSAADLEALRPETTGKSISRGLLDETIAGLAAGHDPASALETGTVAALKDRYLKGVRACEEHWARLETQERTSKVRGRLEEAIARSDLLRTARNLMKFGATGIRGTPVKRTDLDDGVRLP